jgi:MFS family permease
MRTEEASKTRDGFNRKLIAPLVLGSILNPINSSIIAVSLIPIGKALGEPPSRTSLLVTALYVATAIGQPVVGRLVDSFGPRRLYLIGATLAGIGGLLGTVAPNLNVLIVARVILGLGTCAGYPSAMYLIRSEADRTGKDSPAGILTILAVAGQTVAVIGPTLGGLLIGLAGWRATFAINILLSVACLVVGLRRLPVAVPRLSPRAEPVDRGSRLSRVGAEIGGLVRNGPLMRTYLRNLLGYVVAYGYLYGYTQWLEDGRALSPSVAGLILLPTFATAIGVSLLTGRHQAVRAKLIVAAGTQIVGAALLLTAGSGTAIVVLVLISLVAGIPQGLNNLANQNALYHQADPARMGASAGLLRTSTYLGAIVASIATGAFLGNSAGTTGLHELNLFMIGAGVLFLAMTLFDPSLTHVGRTPPKATN